MPTKPEKAIEAADKKTQACEMERISAEVVLRKGFDNARPDAKEAFFKAAIDNMNLDMGDNAKLKYNYTDEDKASPPLNIPARIARVGKFVQDKCMGK